MTLTIKRAGSDEYGRFVKVLLTGEPGSGKTRLSSTFPDPIYANIEGGLMSVVDRQPAYVEIRSLTDLDVLRTALAQPPKARQQILNVSVRTVVIDTLDSLQKILISERLKEQHKEAMAMADWGWLGDTMRDIVRGFRNLDMHVIFCCHVRTVEDSETGAVLVKPALQGQMSDEIPAYVDLAVLLRARPENKVVDGTNVRTLTRIMQTAPDGRHPWLKDRSGRLPMELAVDLTTDFARMNQAIFSDVSPPSSTAASVEAVESKAEEPPKTDGNGAQPRAEESPPVPEQALNGEGQAAQPAEVPQPAESPPSEETKVTAESAALPPCDECGGPIENADQLDLSRIRHRKPLCRVCFAQVKSASKTK